MYTHIAIVRNAATSCYTEIFGALYRSLAAGPRSPVGGRQLAWGLASFRECRVFVRAIGFLDLRVQTWSASALSP